MRRARIYRLPDGRWRMRWWALDGEYYIHTTSTWAEAVRRLP